MPRCDGPTCLRLIHDYFEQNPHFQRPKIIFMTAYSENIFKKEAKQAGADKYIIKPIFKDELQKLLI